SSRRVMAGGSLPFGGRLCRRALNGGTRDISDCRGAGCAGEQLRRRVRFGGRSTGACASGSVVLRGVFGRAWHAGAARDPSYSCSCSTCAGNPLAPRSRLEQVTAYGRHRGGRFPAAAHAMGGAQLGTISRGAVPGATTCGLFERVRPKGFLCL